MHFQDSIGPKSACLDDNFLCQAWTKAVTSGDIEQIERLLRQDIHPDQPLNIEGMTGLQYLIKTPPMHEAQTINLGKTASALINAGAALSIPDYRGLLPADYAMCSPNDLVCQNVVLSTLRQQGQKGQDLFRPAYDRLFATFSQRNGDRLHAWNDLLANAEIIGQYIETLCHQDGGDPLLQDMSMDDYSFWSEPARGLVLNGLPAPSMHMEDMIERYGEIRTTLNLAEAFNGSAYDLNAAMDGAQELRNAEYNFIAHLPRP